MTTTVTEEEALWLYIGELPECRDRRGQVADWYQDREGEVGCKCCFGRGWFDSEMCGNGDKVDCPECDGTGRVSNGNAEMAEALRATADRVPLDADGKGGIWTWWGVNPTGFHPESDLPDEIVQHMTGEPIVYCGRKYPTAQAAIRDLCRAWVKVHKGVTL